MSCPTCDSPAPNLHPATGPGGEVIRLCEDYFHKDFKMPKNLTHSKTERYMDALDYASLWSELANTEESRAYWRGMRDTLKVVVGITKQKPINTTDDPAASTML